MNYAFLWTAHLIQAFMHLSAPIPNTLSLLYTLECPFPNCTYEASLFIIVSFSHHHHHICLLPRTSGPLNPSHLFSYPLNGKHVPVTGDTAQNFTDTTMHRDHSPPLLAFSSSSLPPSFPYLSAHPVPSLHLQSPSSFFKYPFFNLLHIHTVYCLHIRLQARRGHQISL